MTTGWGSIVVNELILPVIGCTLIKGEIHFFGRLEDITTDYEGGVTDMRLFGSDGSSIASARTFVPAYSTHEGTLTLAFPIRITEVTPR